MIKIQFGKSTSQNYSKALRLTKRFNDFQLIENGSTINSINLENEELITKFRILEELHQIIRGWTTTKMLFDEREIHPWRFFNQMGHIVECSLSYENSLDKEKHCNINNTQEGWGCKFINETIKHLNYGGYYSYNENYWYKFGLFKDEQTWLIDKNKIKERIDKEVLEKGISCCPYLNTIKLEKSINDLPSEIDLTSEFWEIIYKEDFFGTTIQKKPASIEHVSKEYKESRQGLSLGISLSGIEDNSESEQENLNENIRNIPKVSFNDIGGIEDIIEIIREVIELPIIKPELFKHLGIKPHKGILLFGEPGNGKTMIAKAIANEIKAHFIPISGPELLSKWHGESEERLREKFIEARDKQPSIIFFDEIDSIAQRRTDSDSGRLDLKFVNQLLTLMDGMETYGNVSVLASTNRPELLDQALLRPGRFDYKLEIKKPTIIGCRKIFEILTKEMPLDNDIDSNTIINKLLGLSGAEIAFVVNEAAYNCLRRNLDLKKELTEDYQEYLDIQELSIKEVDFHLALEKV